MNEDIPILPLLLGAALAVYFGFEVDRRRNKLRQVFNTFDKQESKIAETLERLVASGRLLPYVPPHVG
jgi:hypothetical protein